ncbi:hypothetical protein CSUB01_12397 [Colletotrichum sublineola]|uniref:Biotrophy-associated secreted protein 2 n=1 Tax=Colletotrichum sublineola TaxID=1173701 RepID=A0A066XIV2_COLSU|nr:hypothetical protein CSUB01_12397 [Colletotrichum sublineola]
MHFSNIIAVLATLAVAASALPSDEPVKQVKARGCSDDSDCGVAQFCLFGSCSGEKDIDVRYGPGVYFGRGPDAEQS